MQMLRNLAIGQFYLVGLVGQNGPNQTENTEVGKFQYWSVLFGWSGR